MNSWRKSTQKQYSSYIYKWIRYAKDKDYSITHPKLTEALDFLTFLFDSGLHYSTLNTARSALSNVISLSDNPSIMFGKHPLVIRFMRGVFTLKPKLPKLTEVWNAADVLNYIDSMGKNCDLLLMDLSMKLSMLLALVTGERVQCLHLLDINLMHKYNDKVVFEIRDLLKQSRPGYHKSSLEMKCFDENENLCVVHTLYDYLDRTVNIRNDSSKLLISYQKPFKPVSKDTISRWLRILLGKAGIDIRSFTAHSTRSASSSAAKNNGLPVNIIMDKVGWSSLSTFSKFYDKPIRKQSDYGSSVLKSVSKK